jgi:hypothetical protein
MAIEPPHSPYREISLVSTPLPIFSGSLKRTSSIQQLMLIVIYIATFTSRTLRNNACPRRDCTNQVEIHHYTSCYMHYNYFATKQHVATSRLSADTERQPLPHGKFILIWESTTPPLPGSHSAHNLSHLLCKISLTYYIPSRDADRVSHLDT